LLVCSLFLGCLLGTEFCLSQKWKLETLPWWIMCSYFLMYAVPEVKLQCITLFYTFLCWLEFLWMKWTKPNAVGNKEGKSCWCTVYLLNIYLQWQIEFFFDKDTTLKPKLYIYIYIYIFIVYLGYCSLICASILLCTSNVWDVRSVEDNHECVYCT
jgi:hypothetical protein